MWRPSTPQCLTIFGRLLLIERRRRSEREKKMKRNSLLPCLAVTFVLVSWLQRSFSLTPRLTLLPAFFSLFALRNHSQSPPRSLSCTVLSPCVFLYVGVYVYGSVCEGCGLVFPSLRKSGRRLPSHSRFASCSSFPTPRFRSRLI